MTAATTRLVVPQQAQPAPVEGIVHPRGVDCAECGGPVQRKDRDVCGGCYRDLCHSEDQRRMEMRGQAIPATGWARAPRLPHDYDQAMEG